MSVSEEPTRSGQLENTPESLTLSPFVLRQIVEDWQRAGISHLPIKLAPPPAENQNRQGARTSQQQSVRQQPVQRQSSQQHAQRPVQPATTARASSVSASTAAGTMGEPLVLQAQSLSAPPPKTLPDNSSTSASTPPPTRSLPMIDGKNLSAEECAEQLLKLAKKVAKCTRCEDLACRRTQTVFGVGDPKARIMFIGEAPGADEDKQGEPFVGRAGKLLNQIIEASQLKREELYICNILRCRPDGNRNPTPKEAANCREYLDGQISIVDPEYIICWGTIAAQNLLSVKTPIGKMRRKFHEYEGRKVLCTYHPSYLLRNPSAKKDVWEDMQLFMKDLGVDLQGHSAS